MTRNKIEKHWLGRISYSEGLEIQNNKEKNGNHITKNYITKKEKNKLILNLKNNKTISKILNCINN